MAKIIMARSGSVYRESKTFDRKPAAAAWIAKREGELSEPGALANASAPAATLRQAIERYVSESRTEIGRTKAQVLEAIGRFEIADKRCEEIGSQEIIAFATKLAEGRQPQTVANYMSHLAAVFTIARPAWGFRLNSQAMDDAHKVAKRLGLTAKSRGRERRPTMEELDKLMTHFGEVRARRPGSLPMQMIAAFAIFSTRRQDEIVRLQWRDLDEKRSRIVIRDMKHPGQKIGNDVRCDLPEPAMRLIRATPRADERIFPFSTDAISAAFTRACTLLEIDDLHFHDLRHEGVSRLFEMGGTVASVAAVSGHRSWQSLKRYTHLDEAGDRYEGWPWLEALTASS